MNTLVTSACGLVGRIIKQLKIVEGQKASHVDISASNIGQHMSLCGLKFEKLIKSTPALQKCLEYQTHTGKPQTKTGAPLKTYQEAKIYGFDLKGTEREVVKADGDNVKESDIEDEMKQQRAVIKEAVHLITEAMPKPEPVKRRA